MNSRVEVVCGVREHFHCYGSGNIRVALEESVVKSVGHLHFYSRTYRATALFSGFAVNRIPITMKIVIDHFSHIRNLRDTLTGPIVGEICIFFLSQNRSYIVVWCYKELHIALHTIGTSSKRSSFLGNSWFHQVYPVGTWISSPEYKQPRLQRVSGPMFMP